MEDGVTFDADSLNELSITKRENSNQNSWQNDSAIEINDLEKDTGNFEPDDLHCPDEILLNILLMLPKKDLLQNCRLVNKRWNQFATEGCRKRFVLLDKWELVDRCNIEEEDFSTTFNTYSLPWSSRYFNSSHQFKKIHIKARFLTMFGGNIWEINHELDDHILSILKQTPNLKRLKLRDAAQYGDEDEEEEKGPSILDMVIYPQIGEINLPRLKHLEMEDLDDATAFFFKSLTKNCGVKLDYFKTKVSISSAVNIGAIPYLLNGIKFLSLKLDYTGITFQTIVKKMDCLSVRKLNLTLYLHPLSILQDYDTAKKLLAAHSRQLEKLELLIIIPSDIWPTPFEFPVFPHVTAFSITFAEYQFGVRVFRDGFLSRLHGNEFPELERLCVRDEVWDSSMPPITNIVFPEKIRLDSVTELTVHTNRRLRDNWNEILPSLKRLCLTTHVHNYSGAETLFNALSCTTLEKLSIDIGIGPGIDINYLLTGIPYPEDVYQKSEEEINQARAACHFPSILQLSNLKELSIELDGIEHGTSIEGINDAGACLLLLLVPPLDELMVNRLDVSEECRAKLMSRHNILNEATEEDC